MSLKEIYTKKSKYEPIISFEVYPPKGGKNSIEALIAELKILEKFKPALISLTYGAGGAARESSMELTKKIKNEVNITMMPHFTCVCSSRGDIEQYLKEIEQLGIKNILALRGDEPKESEICHMDFKYASDLIKFIKSKTDLSIGVAGYPEGHIDCESLDIDILNLKKKIDSGGDVIYSQLFFDNDKFLKFRDKVQSIGIKSPLVAGILPITSFAQLDKMLTMCRVSVPKNLSKKLEKYKDNPDDIRKLGLDFASEQCAQLIENEIAGLHFYTLNKSYTSAKILENLM